MLEGVAAVFQTIFGLAGAAIAEIEADPKTNPPSLFGQGCYDKISYAFGGGASLGVFWGMGLNFTVIPPHRIEINVIGPFGGGGGVGAFPLGISSGKSKGFGIGGQVIAGMPAGLVGTVSGDISEAGESMFAGIGAGATTVASASGLINYTFVPFDRCK